MDVKKILEDHKKWLDDEEGGCRADLRGADLRYADLRGADLRGADLWRADLCRADLGYADLCRADLCGAKQRIILITGSRHSIYAIDDDVRIGCCRQSLKDWLENFKTVGEKHEYTPSQIEEYGVYLRGIEQVLKLER